MKVRQVCFFFIAFLPAIKLFSMASNLCFYSERDLLISYALNAVLDIGLLMLLLLTAKKGQSYKNLLENNFGKVTAKSIMFLYFLFFLIKAFPLINEQKNYIETTLYETTPSVATFLVFFVLSIYLCLKDLKVLGRIADVMFFTTTLALVVVFALSFLSGKYGTLLPIGKKGINPIFQGSFHTLIWNGDALYLLFILGDIKRTELDKKTKPFLKITLSYVFACVMVFIFLLIFYAIFNYLGVRQAYAIAEISKYSVFLANTTRFDYIAIFLLISSAIFGLALPVYFSTQCLNNCFKFKFKLSPAIITNGILILVLTLLDHYTLRIQMFLQNYFSYAILLVGYILPALTPLLKKKESKYAISQS